jgi:hypothetical protein
MSNPRHFAKFRGEEVIVVGHKKSMNECLVCRLTMLPQEESQQLRRIAMSSTAQGQDYLVDTLKVEAHKSNSDWMSYIATRLIRKDGSVISIPIKELEDMNVDQKAFFKGYGKSLRDEEKRVIDSDEDDYIKAKEVSSTTLSEQPPKYNDQMMTLMASLVEGQNKLASELANLTNKLQPSKLTKKRIIKKKAGRTKSSPPEDTQAA